jgi:aquaporin Z
MMMVMLTLTLMLMMMMTGRPLGGASMNPFRSLAPALLAGGEALDQVWIYVVGPLLGAVIAVLLTGTLGCHVHPYAWHKATGTPAPA